MALVKARIAAHLLRKDDGKSCSSGTKLLILNAHAAWGPHRFLHKQTSLFVPIGEHCSVVALTADAVVGQHR